MASCLNQSTGVNHIDLAPFLFAELPVPVAVDQVVVDHPHGLHEGVADCAADEAKAAPQGLLPAFRFG